MDCLNEIYGFIKSHDLPNWIIFIFSVICWPAFLYFWNKRKVTHIKNLKISLNRDLVRIGENNVEAVRLTITNSTSNTLFITNIRLKSKDKNFEVNRNSTRDFYTGYYELLFLDPISNLYTIRDIVVYTDKSQHTVLGLENVAADSMFTFKQNHWFRLLRLYKYFILEYTILVGEKRYFVKTRY